MGNEKDIREWLAVGDRTERLKAAVAGFLVEWSPLKAAPKHEIAEVIAEITGFVRLVGPSWHPEQRGEYVDQLMIEFADLPPHRLIPAIQIARKSVRRPGDFVPEVNEILAARFRMRDKEKARLDGLARIAGI